MSAMLDPAPQGASAQGRLLADVGGTNARFAWQAQPQGALTDVRTYACADYPSLQAAIETYLADTGRNGAGQGPAQGAIGIANPIVGDQVHMTNHHWSFSIEALRQAIGLERLVVINDFTALALALPTLAPEEKRQIRAGQPDAGGALALIGPGTGLGVSGLVPAGDGSYRPLQGEGGHVTLAAVTPREQAVVAVLQKRFGHASAERAVSGLGLVWMYEALCELDGVPVPAGLDAPTISAKALDRSDARADETLALMFAFLGSVAGNLALTLGARGGVYLGGGVLPRVIERLETSAFHERFLSKGRFRAYMESVPVYLIQAKESPALRGVAEALR
jgi:glucokinase